MAGLNQVLLAVIMAIVVFAAVKGGGGPIAHAFENTAKIFGLDVGKPRIGSFTASPTADGDVRFELSIAGNKKDVVLEIYESRAGDDKTAKELKAPDPEFGSKSLRYSSKGISKVMDEDAKKGVLIRTCPGGDGCCGTSAHISDCRGDAFAPDWYKFSAVLKKNGKTVFQSEALAGLYNKEYVELLDKPVQGCPDCNVRECKRKVLINSLSPRKCINGVKVVYSRVYNELYPPIVGPVLKSPEMASCEYPPSKLPITDREGFKAVDAFNLCPVKEINKLHLKASHWVFFDEACGSVGMTDETVKQVEKLFNVEGGRLGIDIANGETQQKLSDCARKAEEAFTAMGWRFILTKQEMEEYKIPEDYPITLHYMARSDVMKETDKYLQNELPPIAWNLKASLEADEKLKISWGVPVGSKNVQSVGLAYMYRNYVSSDDKFADIAPPVSLSKDARSYVITPKGVTGQHRFIITEQAANAPEVSISPADFGFYNNEYIELYLDLKGVDDACGGDCDVIGKKVDALLNGNLGLSKKPGSSPSQTYTEIAHSKYMNPEYKATCTNWMFTKKQKDSILKACPSSELNELYVAVVTDYASDNPFKQLGKTVGDLLKIDCWGERTWIDSEPKYKSTGIKQVCEAKDKLRSKLSSIGWAYVS